MKKGIAFAMILALLLAVSTTAAATETESGNSQEVLASYEEGTQDKTVISVDISWEQMSFTYRGASTPTWDAEEHRYEGEATEAGWAPGNGIITIRNNSNAILQTNISYNQEAAYKTVDMTFTDKAPYIGSAYTDDRIDEEGIPFGTPCEVTIKAIPTGTLNKDTQDNTKIGTITITVNAGVDVYNMLDTLEARIAECTVQSTEGLKRGAVYLATGADAGLYSLTSEASAAYGNSELTPAEKNVAINKALTAFYGALNIAQ